MDTPKRDIAWVVSSQLDRARTYTAVDIDRMVRGTIRGEFINNPSLAPDHIRAAMVEAGYLKRDVEGAYYRVAEGFVGPEDEAERERKLLEAAGELSVQGGVVACPACGERVGATSLVGHCQRSHRWSVRWPQLVGKYCR